MSISIPLATDAIKNFSKNAAAAAQYQLALAQQIAQSQLQATDNATIVAIANIIAMNFEALASSKK